MLYFAYGSNMDSVEIARNEKCPGALFAGTGYLINRRLVINKKSLKRGLATNIESSYGDKVYGVIYDITDEAEWKNLDKTESGYIRMNASVRMLPDRHIESAVTYEAAPEFIVSEGPTLKVYRDRLVKGAREHNLPDEYVKFLESLAVNE